MAITVAMRTEVSQLYVALFGRAPDSEGLGFWVSQRNSGQSMTQIADAMFATAPARAYFPTWMTNQEIIGSFYSNVLGRTADAEGLAFWTGKLNAAGATPGSVITEMITAIANYNGTDPDGLASAALFNNKVEVAQYYAEDGGTAGNATIVLADVTADPATVDAAIADIDAGTVGESPDTPQSIFLEVGQDVKAGGDANDTFTSFVVQNSLGHQVNTLGSGDVLAGGAGTDALNAKVTAGVFAGSAGGLLGSQTMPIQPMTTGIENVKIEAVNSGIGIMGLNIPGLGELGNLGLGETNVYINAKDMLGVDMIGSWHSDANLVIQNMTTQDNTGTARELSDLTVVMGYTGNRDSHWAESDLSVYFDQDYLNPSIVRTRPSIDIRLMNEDAYDATHPSNPAALAPFRPLTGVYIAEMNFTLNGVSYDLDEIIDEDFNNGGTEIETYDELLAAIQDALVILKAANPGDLALQSVTAEFGADFLSDISPTTGVQRVGQSITLSVEGTTGGVANTLLVGEDDLQILKANDTPLEIGNSNRYERAEATPSDQSQELRINVELEKVGLAGDGGGLIIGSMYKDGQNQWTDQYDGKGIDIFDVTVSGAADKPSSLSYLHSTGNNLREVYVDTNAAQTGSYADLTIGNQNSPFLSLPDSMELGDVVDPSWRNQGALKDVRIFDASGLKGDLTLYAGLTNDVTEKYMTLVDEANDAPELDNVEFVYTGGTGNDYINLWLSDYNLAKAGSTTREDFELTINGGAGNDEIVTMIGEGYAGFGEDVSLDENLVDSQWDNWYQNSAINANLAINGDAGDDTIRTLGSGNWVIDGGSGADTIYADNTGGEDGGEDNYFNDGKATWVFNSVNNDVEDLLSQNGATVSAVNAELTVNFMGYSKKVAIADSVGKLANVTITDLHINQAIKLAINSDPVLSKLLVAEDGPARTLIVRSLIDGQMDDGWADYGIDGVATNAVDQLTIRFSTASLTAAQTNPALVLFSAVAPVGGTLLDGYNPTTDATFGWDDNATLEGEDSENVADNDIEGGTANDVIVLGTGMWSNDTLVYNGFANGTDSIVNFQDNYTGGEQFQTGEDGVREVVTLTFSDSDGSPAAQTIIFDGETVTLAAPVVMGVIPAEDVAFQFFQQFDSANWEVVSHTTNTNSVVIQTKLFMEVTPDVAAADFTGTYFGAANGNGTVTPLTTTQGADPVVPGTFSNFIVDFDTAGTAAAAAGAFVFDGVNTPYLAGDGSVTLAATLVANAAAFGVAGWSVTLSGDGTAVAFQSTVVGDEPIGTAADFDLGTNNIVGTIAGTVGVDDAPGELVIIPPGPETNFDFIDFTSYDVTGVVINDSNQVNDIRGSEVNGIVGTANGVATRWITMTESTTNDGVYTINLVTSTVAGAADDTVQLIGVADFGYEKDFTDYTFFL
ncbi:DUF4214 domain-containing protein [Ramlibacter sp. WS9]|uniref:DUF4214 domain-containing protein n=1 Tax=Ramlibacter sp. WS9 TaxID=1882741 RepID=UPI001143AA2E|nr:DUF4214 domain-containing protein [Ramlibacter sp. WS9]ROZ77449.1 DUF4214 domain-containing protein [Ramlibacter sp. WS9]